MTRKAKSRSTDSVTKELAQIAAEVGGVVLGPLHIEILSAAGRRPNGSILPLPETLPDDPDAVAEAIATLLQQDLIETVEVGPKDVVWRADGDRKESLRLTMPGCILIGVPFLDYMYQDDRMETDNRRRQSPPTPQRRKPTKTDTILKSLQRKKGAAITHLTAATGWQAHSVRAALTGLRKKGHAIERTTNAKGVAVYRIEARP